MVSKHFFAIEKNFIFFSGNLYRLQLNKISYQFTVAMWMLSQDLLLDSKNIL